MICGGHLILVLDVLADVSGVELAVGETHVGGEGGVGTPLGRGAGGGLLEHAVDLLQRQTLEVFVSIVSRVTRAE